MCSNCSRIGKACDYSLKLTWGGRPYKNKEKRKASPIFYPPPVLGPPTVVKFVASKFDKKLDIEPSGAPIHRHNAKTEEKDGKTVIKVEPNDKIEALLDSADIEAQGPDLIAHGSPLALHNSELFDSFINTVDPTSEGNQNIVHSPLFAELYENYSADIARTENSFPEEPKNFVTGSIHPTLLHKGPLQHTVAPSSLATPTHNDHEPFLLHSEDHDYAVMNSMAHVPRALTPLPELLMNVPHYRQLLHFWVNVAAVKLVPAPSHMYQDNPFKVLLPQIAMHYPGVLTTILAFSAKVRNSIDGVTQSQQGTIDQLLGRSCNELLKQLQDKKESTSDGTLASILLLSCYEVINSNDCEKHRTHIIGASQIISARRILQQPVSGSPTLDTDSDSFWSPDSSLSKFREESDMTFFLMRWFAYIDVLGALSSSRGRENYLRSYKTKGKYTPVVNMSTLDINSAYTGNHKTDIDYLLGFDVRLLPHFVNIALLIDEVERLGVEDADRTKLPIEIIAAALELKERFTQGYEDGEEKRQKTIDLLIESKLKVKKSNSPRSTRNINELVRHDNILRATNKLFFDTGLLNLYRRVLLLPRLSPLVQDLVETMAEVLEYGVELGSSAEICTIFCHFYSACETLDVLKRQFYFDRFSRLSRDGNLNATKSLVIMDRCWETGEDWITAANQLDIDLVLL